MYPYYPSPAQLWGPDYKADTKNNKEEVTDRSSKGKKRVVEYFSEEEDHSEDDEVLPAPSKRGAPKARWFTVSQGFIMMETNWELLWCLLSLRSSVIAKKKKKSAAGKKKTKALKTKKK